MENSNIQKSCCEKETSKTEKKGFLAGFLYGLIPHTFCIAFILFSVIGATSATLIFKKLLLIPHSFYILIGLSFISATISAIIYLKRNGILSSVGIKRKWRYLSILYGTTIFINILFFLVIFPYLANISSNKSTALIETLPLSSITLEIAIPCSGHAFLISEEILKLEGVKDVEFKLPNLFNIKYDSFKISEEQITSLDIFNTYQATIVK